MSTVEDLAQLELDDNPIDPIHGGLLWKFARGGVLKGQHVDVCLGTGTCPFGPLQASPVMKTGPG
jgi:hypothetical protein